jgi:hypothetical protein
MVAEDEPDMYTTAEVRWFYEGRAPALVEAWFRRGGRAPTEQPARVDHYLRLVDGEHQGIKLREGRLEVKQRERSLPATRFNAGAAGVMELWRKWSIPLAGCPHQVSSDPGASWIEVEKERALCRYRLLEDRRIVATGTDWYPDQGCDLELTAVRVRGREWWTLALEAFGPSSSVCENLQLFGEVVFGAGEPPSLDAADSYGYPRWLELVG